MVWETRLKWRLSKAFVRRRFNECLRMLAVMSELCQSCVSFRLLILITDTVEYVKGNIG